MAEDKSAGGLPASGERNTRGAVMVVSGAAVQAMGPIPNKIMVYADTKREYYQQLNPG